MLDVTGRGSGSAGFEGVATVIVGGTRRDTHRAVVHVGEDRVRGTAHASYDGRRRCPPADGSSRRLHARRADPAGHHHDRQRQPFAGHDGRLRTRPRDLGLYRDRRSVLCRAPGDLGQRPSLPRPRVRDGSAPQGHRHLPCARHLPLRRERPEVAAGGEGDAGRRRDAQ